MKCWVITEFAFTLYVDTADFGLIGPLLNGGLSEIIGIVVFIMTVISQLFSKSYARGCSLITAVRFWNEKYDCGSFNLPL